MIWIIGAWWPKAAFCMHVEIVLVKKCGNCFLKNRVLLLLGLFASCFLASFIHEYIIYINIKDRLNAERSNLWQYTRSVCNTCSSHLESQFPFLFVHLALLTE